MKKTKIYWLIASLVILALAAVGYEAGSKSEKTQSPPSPVNINIATATTGGVYYPLGNAMVKMFNQNVPNVRAAAQATAGTPQNILLMQRKDAEIAFAQNGVAYYAYYGLEFFRGKADKSLRSITHLYPNIMHIVVNANSGISSVKHLEGKKFVPGAIGSATEINSKEILDLYGLDYKDKKNLKAEYLGYSEAATALKEGRADAILIAGGLPTKAILDVASSMDIKILSLEEDAVRQLVNEMPWYYEVTIPKGTYTGQNEDVRTVALANILICQDNLSEDLVYNITKILYENSNELAAAHPAAKNMTLERALDGLTVPLHPGSKKYYQEKGLDIKKQSQNISNL